MTNASKVRLLEVASVLTILASIAALALPKSAALQRKDIAAQVAADIEVVRAAVYAFYSDSAYFPTRALGESVPENLAMYLPRGFVVSRQYGSLEYRNWPVRARDGGAEASHVVGVTITLRDPRVGAALIAGAPSAAKFVLDDKYTFVLFGT